MEGRCWRGTNVKRRPRQVSLVLCIAGAILPYSQLVPFLRERGLDLETFVQQLFASGVSGFFALDVIVSSVVLAVFVITEGRRLGMKHLWAPIVANLAVGVSLGLPLFLYMREAQIDQKPASTEHSQTMRPRSGDFEI